jgi:hypothetical protein
MARLGTLRMCGAMLPTWAGFSPDGKRVASYGLFTVTVWDTATGRQILQRGHSYNVVLNAVGWRADGTGVAVLQLPDESYFVSAFTNPAEMVPDPPRAVRASIPNPYVHYLALSPDATRLAVVRTPDGEKFTIDLLPATPGRPVAALKPERTLGPFPGPCREVRYTAGGQLVTLHGPWEENKDWSIAVLDPRRNVVVRTARIPAPGFCPWQFMLSVSADARLAAVAPRTRIYPNDHDGTVRVWD